jgi:hypothetical protein
MACFLTCRALLGVGQMNIIDPIACERTVLPEPGKLFRVTLRLHAAILRPLDVRWLAQHVGHDKRADVDPRAIVEVRLPSDGLFVDRLPTDKNIIGWLAFKDKFDSTLAISVGRRVERSL